MRVGRCTVEDAARSPDAADGDVVSGTMPRGAKRGHEREDGVRGVRARGGDVVERAGAHSSSRSTACRSSQVAPGQHSPTVTLPSAVCPSDAAHSADGERRDGVPTTRDVPMVQREHSVEAMATPSSAGDSDAHCAQVSRHDEMRGVQGRRAWKSIFTDHEDESESEGDVRPCVRKRERMEDGEPGGIQREPSRRRVDSTDAPT